MATNVLPKKVTHQKIGKIPVVVLPLDQWREVEAKLEDYEMLRSESYRKSIAGARRQVKQGKLHRLDFRTGKFTKVSKP